MVDVILEDLRENEDVIYINEDILYLLIISEKTTLTKAWKAAGALVRPLP